MRSAFSCTLVLLLLLAPSAYAAGGMIPVKSSHPAKESADRVERLLKERGMTLFNRIDHADGARRAGMELRPTEVLIFGNPKGGTPLMVCEQRVGIDLPLKMLVWEDEGKTTWVAYTDPWYWKDRYGIVGCDEVLRKMKGFLEKLASDAAHPDS